MTPFGSNSRSEATSVFQSRAAHVDRGEGLSDLSNLILAYAELRFSEFEESRLCCVFSEKTSGDRTDSSNAAI